MLPMLTKGTRVFIFVDNPVEMCAIWLWIYIRNVNPDHRPCFMMMVSATPWSLRAIAPPARREWAATRSGSIPFLSRPHALTERLMDVIISEEVIYSQSEEEVRLYWQMRDSLLPPCETMWCARLASAWVGPVEVLSMASWNIVWPIRPFF